MGYVCAWEILDCMFRSPAHPRSERSGLEKISPKGLIDWTFFLLVKAALVPAR